MRHWANGPTGGLRLFVAAVILSLLGAAGGDLRAGELYLALIWHQHQPLYLDPQTDQLRGPWVRTHATKDYYDMAAMHRDFPEVHATINLTSSLLSQLENYYVARLARFIVMHRDGLRAIDTTAFFAKWRGKTDPWVDLALRPSREFDSTDRAKLLTEPWNAFGISPVQIARFPEYAALREKAAADPSSLTTDDLTAVKAWFFLAHFDPDFLRGTSPLDVNLSDLLAENDGTFTLRHPLSERDANRLVADAVRVMRQIVPEHRALVYDPASHKGQLEIITTPYYHPILPLLMDSDVARECQPRDSLPARFAYAQDARAQVIKSVAFYERMFGIAPRGMWPAEGSISEAAATTFAGSGIRWICGDMRVLMRSKPPGLPIATPYRIETPNGDIAILFRETNLSDHIGFTYQRMQPDSAAAHFMSEVMRFRPTPDEPDRLLTVILDGENAWEWYEQDMDGKQFLRSLCQRFTDARARGELTCVTPTEYLLGDPARELPPHPVASLPKIDTLWPGSWINANFDTWIGEPEENKAWEYLLQTRRDLEASGLRQPEPTEPQPTEELALAAWQAYESMYAAEGSDWFWWYGADQTASGGETPFEDAFFSHLRAVYDHIRETGIAVNTPEFKPILSAAKVRVQTDGDVMARGEVATAGVKFVCKATLQVPVAIYIVGNLPELGTWRPNTVRLFDDGTHGDVQAGDGLWTLELQIPLGTEVQYKYTNSGAPGVWVPSEEFAFRNRSFTVDGPEGGLIIRQDVFGE